MRTSGILMHISSLPSPWGIGTMGGVAREFVDFLARAGQRYWQLLPVGPTSYGDSPYQSFSAFAGNPYFIDLDDLAQEGLLRREEYAHLDWGSPDQVDYGLLYHNRYPVLRRAVERLLAATPPDYEDFRRKNTHWLGDYALFMAIKQANDGVSWQEWEEGLRNRDPGSLETARRSLAGEVTFWEGTQYLFYRQWIALRAVARERGVAIIGDLPIYVAYDSADVWAEREQFQLDEGGRPTEVSGCPPDGFCETGQLWGNPLFNWKAMRADNYRWWRERIKHQFALFDTLRIDHFRGFDSYYAIPYGDPDARFGSWRPGPGMELFRTIEGEMGRRSIIAEDLGYLTDSVRQLLTDSGYPGMKVLQFAFDSREDNDYLPHNYPHRCVVYTGTHDNDTILGWMDHAPSTAVQAAKEYLRLTQEEGWEWGMMRGAWASVGELAVVTMQDLLGLDNSARMNAPSILGGNWKWRALPGQITRELAARIHHEMEVYRRLPDPNGPLI